MQINILLFIYFTTILSFILSFILADILQNAIGNFDSFELSNNLRVKTQIRPHHHRHRHHRRPQQKYNNVHLDPAEIGYLQEIRANWHSTPWHLLHQIYQLKGLNRNELNGIELARQKLIASIKAQRELTKDEFKLELPQSVINKLKNAQNIPKWHLNAWHLLHHIYHIKGLNRQERIQIEKAKKELENLEMRGTPMNVEAFKQRLPIRLQRLLEQQETQLRAKTQQQIGQIGGGIVNGFIPQPLGQGIVGQQQAGWKARRRVQIVRQRKWI